MPSLLEAECLRGADTLPAAVTDDCCICVMNAIMLSASAQGFQLHIQPLTEMRLDQVSLYEFSRSSDSCH
jgi:hypothetical protein